MPNSVPDRDPAWVQLRNALLRPSKGQIIVGVLMLILGLAISTQVRANQRDDTYAGYREQDLIEILTGLTAAQQRAESEIRRLEAAREDLLTSSDQQQAALEQARQQATTIGILAGTIPVEGPGLRVTITPSSESLSLGSFLDTFQELRTAGAEAMEFNDSVRIVAQSSINETSIGISIDGQLLSGPYVLEVIGDPHTLSGALDFPFGPVSQFEDDDATVTIEELDNLEIRSTVSTGAAARDSGAQ